MHKVYYYLAFSSLVSFKKIVTKALFHCFLSELSPRLNLIRIGNHCLVCYICSCPIDFASEKRIDDRFDTSHPNVGKLAQALWDGCLFPCALDFFFYDKPTLSRNKGPN